MKVTGEWSGEKVSFKTRMEDRVRHADYRFRSRVRAWRWRRALWGGRLTRNEKRERERGSLFVYYNKLTTIELSKLKIGRKEGSPWCVWPVTPFRGWKGRRRQFWRCTVCVFYTNVNVQWTISVLTIDLQVESSGWLFKSPLAGEREHIVSATLQAAQLVLYFILFIYFIYLITHVTARYSVQLSTSTG